MMSGQPERLITALAEQRQMLEASARSYDAGNSWEAKRMATAIHVLMFDKGRQESLLRRLNVRGKLGFVSTKIDLPEGVMPFAPLTLIGMGARAEITPQCLVWPDANPNVQLMRFHVWWDQLIYKTPGLGGFTRATLITMMRDRDAAHVDNSTSPLYEAMAASVDPRITVSSKTGGERGIPGAHLATVRQIAWEVLETLKQLD
ncbi:hypothetical protein SAMN05428959_1011138 [Duganella sp. CF517]|uniref:hypothetical protein n=1 Tax=Duganella sp. CF517 TaxID=1881038 RepID=UPI0008AB9BCC|nr:hypothetical protein [Duganella sp. CF517]SEN31476.1 hypothetical protein SAMN05428959_1011138 [Duganella sp. CF517]